MSGIPEQPGAYGSETGTKKLRLPPHLLERQAFLPGGTGFSISTVQTAGVSRGLQPPSKKRGTGAVVQKDKLRPLADFGIHEEGNTDQQQYEAVEGIVRPRPPYRINGIGKGN